MSGFSTCRKNVYIEVSDRLPFSVKFQFQSIREEAQSDGIDYFEENVLNAFLMNMCSSWGTQALHKIKDGFIETFCKSRDFHTFFFLSLFTKARKCTLSLAQCKVSSRLKIED